MNQDEARLRRAVPGGYGPGFVVVGWGSSGFARVQLGYSRMTRPQLVRHALQGTGRNFKEHEDGTIGPVSCCRQFRYTCGLIRTWAERPELWRPAILLLNGQAPRRRLCAGSRSLSREQDSGATARPRGRMSENLSLKVAPSGRCLEMQRRLPTRRHARGGRPDVSYALVAHTWNGGLAFNVACPPTSLGVRRDERRFQ